MRTRYGMTGTHFRRCGFGSDVVRITDGSHTGACSLPENGVHVGHSHLAGANYTDSHAHGLWS
jgi:hypothetical protein